MARRLICVAVALFLVASCDGLFGPSTFRVTYDGNGYTSGAVPSDGTSYSRGQTVTVLGNTGGLARDGYAFAGWNTAASGTGTGYEAGDTFAMGRADVTLFAAWEPLAGYSVTYDANGATTGTVPVDDARYLPGRQVTVMDNTGSLAMPGYVFAGWNTQAAGTGTAYAPGSVLTMGEADVVLYARWTSTTHFSVIYHRNGATSGAVPVDSASYAAGSVVTVLGNSGNLVKTGYAFAGWNTQAAGTGIAYLAGGTLVMGAANLTLYAAWSQSGGAAVVVELPPSGALLYSRPLAGGETLLSAGLGPELPLNEWTTWRIDSAEYVWLPVNVVSGLTYTVNWDDNYEGTDASDGSPTYTGDIEVGAFLEDKVTRVSTWSLDEDSGYLSGWTFSVTTAQTVWLRVQPYGGSAAFCGGFGIKVSQAGLPASGGAYAWYLNGAPIGGAVDRFYTLDPASVPVGFHRLTAVSSRSGVTFSVEHVFVK